VYGFVRACL
nr:Chain C, Telomerase reverse transcriptase [synthetic construct]2BCK_F Chain F, Telomerase reverse transcriptase [synthetic construct]